MFIFGLILGLIIGFFLSLVLRNDPKIINDLQANLRSAEKHALKLQEELTSIRIAAITSPTTPGVITEEAQKASAQIRKC